MTNLESLNLLRNILTSHDKKRHYSTNTYKQFYTYKCPEHNHFYYKICLKCNIDICPKCEKIHNSHQTLRYEEIVPDDYEINNLKNCLKAFRETFSFLRKEIINWFNDIKEKVNCFEQIYKKNEIINSYDIIMNYPPNNIICLDTIYKFRKVYANIMDKNNSNSKNKTIFKKINYFGNDNQPIYLNFQEINNLLINLNKSKDDIVKKNDLIMKYLMLIPKDLNNSSEKYNSINNNKKSMSSISPIEQINSNSICDKSTGNDNYKTISDKKKADEFKKILNKTIITDFNIENTKERYSNNSNKDKYLNNPFLIVEKNNNLSTFSKYLNKMGFILNNQELRKVNSSQNLLNNSYTSIKSTKYICTNSNQKYVYKKNNNIISGTKSAMNSPKSSSIFKSNFYEYNTKEINYNDKNWYEHPLLTTKKTQKKIFVHKKMKNKLLDSKIKFGICNTEIKKDNNIIEKKIIKSSIFNNNNKKDNNNNILKNENKVYEKPCQKELFKYNTINDINNNNNHNYNMSNEQNNSKQSNKNSLLNLIYSPSSTRNKSSYNLTKINKINFNSQNSNSKIKSFPKITKINLNTPIMVNPEKKLYVGLELDDAECKIGIINQTNINEIQLLDLEEENSYSIPTVISFSENKKEIKIGKDAEKGILKNPSQTIFNIIKYLGKEMKDIKNQNELLPFKIYNTNDNEDKSYIKINFGPQKDKIIYMDNILGIYLQKLFEIFIKKIKLETKLNNITLKMILSIAVPNYFTYYQRKLIETIFRQEVIPKINNDINNNNENKVKLDLEKIYIKNSSNVASLCLNLNNIKYNINNNILIININGGSSNVSIISLYKEKNNDKIYYKILASNGLDKGYNNILDDFMIYILKNKFEVDLKNKIVNSPLAILKMREMCNKIKLDLSQNEKTTFKINEIISNSELVFEINRKEYEKFFYDFIFDLKQLIKKLFEQKKMNNCAINQILYIGDIFNDEKIKLDIEQLLIEKNLLSEEILNNENKDLDKEFYNVGGSAYYAMSINNNHENNINDFQDLSSFNIGIKIYNDTLFYFIKKGDIIPMKKSALIKLNKNSNIEIYEEDSKTKNKKLIWKFDINNEFIMNNNLNEKKSKYFEIIIEYQINEELNLILRISNGKNFSKELFFNILSHLS